MDENEEKRSRKLKFSTMFIVFGVIVLALAVFFAVLAIKGFQAWQAGYDAWSSDFLASGDTSGKPKAMFFIWVVLAMFSLAGGISLLGFGLRPFITKAHMKVAKETFDYAGKDISDVGVTGVEIAKPVIEKSADTVAPAFAKIVGQSANAIAPAFAKIKGTNAKFCSKCGAKIQDGKAFCSNCGNKVQNVCKYCGAVNDLDDNFCGKCGKKLG